MGGSAAGKTHFATAGIACDREALVADNAAGDAHQDRGRMMSSVRYAAFRRAEVKWEIPDQDAWSGFCSCVSLEMPGLSADNLSSMNSQMRRAITLDRWLRSGRRVTAVIAAQELGVNERTIRRDLLEVLGREWRLPICYDRSTRCWYYDGATTALPSTVVAESDRFSLLVSLQAAEQYKGTPLYERMIHLHRRLLDVLPPEQRTRFAALAQRIRFAGSPNPPIPTANWNTIVNALDDQTSLEIEYRSGFAGSASQRRFDPYAIVVRHRQWYAIGYDHKHRAVRTFFLPRILTIVDTDRHFRMRSKFNLDAYLSTAIDGQQSAGRVYQVKLRFTTEAKALGEEFVWTPAQQLSRDRRGRVVVEFSTAALFEVERQVLEFGGLVQALRPLALRQRLARSIARLTLAHDQE